MATTYVLQFMKDGAVKPRIVETNCVSYRQG
jgi:hypothetical protein